MMYASGRHAKFWEIIINNIGSTKILLKKKYWWLQAKWNLMDSWADWDLNVITSVWLIGAFTDLEEQTTWQSLKGFLKGFSTAYPGVDDESLTIKLKICFLLLMAFLLCFISYTIPSKISFPVLHVVVICVQKISLLLTELICIGIRWLFLKCSHQ